MEKVYKREKPILVDLAALDNSNPEQRLAELQSLILCQRINST